MPDKTNMPNRGRSKIIGSGMMSDIETVYKFPTLIDIASIKDRTIILTERPEYIQYLKRPTFHEECLVLRANWVNIKYIKSVSKEAIMTMLDEHIEFIDVLDDDQVVWAHDYIERKYIKTLLGLHENSKWGMIISILKTVFNKKRR